MSKNSNQEFIVSVKRCDEGSLKTSEEKWRKSSAKLVTLKARHRSGA